MRAFQSDAERGLSTSFYVTQRVIRNREGYKFGHTGQEEHVDKSKEKQSDVGQAFIRVSRRHGIAINDI